MSTFLIGLALACIALALGLLLFVAVRPPDRFDVRRVINVQTTTSVPCCAAGTHGNAGSSHYQGSVSK